MQQYQEILSKFRDLLMNEFALEALSATFLVNLTSVFIATAPLYLLAAYVHRHAIAWLLWKRHVTKRWIGKQKARRNFLLTCGATEVAALSTVLDGVNRKLLELLNPKRLRWNTNEFRALRAYGEEIARALEASGNDPIFTIDERIAAMDSLAKYLSTVGEGMAKAYKHVERR